MPISLCLAATPALAAPDGAALFATHCAQCHQATGEGAEGLAPSLVGTLKDYLSAADGKTYLAQILVSGMAGRIESQGRVVVGIMPSFAPYMSDAELAAVIDYALDHFNGVSGDPITPDQVAAARAAKPTSTTEHKLREQIKAGK